MLTKTQIKNLESLTIHPRFGKLLTNAMEQWSKEDVNITTGSYGITIVSSEISTKANAETGMETDTELTRKLTTETDTEVNSLEKEYSFAHEDKRCCLIGASLIGKTPGILCDIESSLYDNYFVNAREFYYLYCGFDSDLDQEEELRENIEAFKFGRDVKKALNLEKL